MGAWVVPGLTTVGLWCPDCLSHSGYQIRLGALFDDGHGVDRVGILTECVECPRKSALLYELE